MRKSGLARGGSLENAVVIGETGVLNGALRFEDECVRHKAMDAVGDLALLGHPILGRLEAVKAGHALHAAVAQKLMATPDAFELVSAKSLPGLGRDEAPAPALRPARA
jgi:UDP-3-O-[3-hydroxymyristoyl] N-acetylglucosamine deacetylase